MAYSKQTWVRGEKVASVKLNHMEDGIEAIAANGAIGTANLANASVTNEKLDQGAVDSSNIANGAVGTTEIQDGAVTSAKLADSAYHNTAATFSTSKAYAAGDYCIYSGALYRFTANKTAGAWDGTKVVSVALADNMRELNDAFLKSNDGVQTFYGLGDFQHYGLNTDGTFLTTQKYRVSNDDPMTFDRPLTISVKTGFKWGYIPFVDGTAGSWSGWKTEDFTISAGTEFVVQIARVQEITTEVADVDTFVDAVTFKTKDTSRLDGLAADVDRLSDNLDALATVKYNYFNPDSALSGYYYDGDVGSVISARENANYACVIFPVEKNKTYVVSRTDYRWNELDDDNKILERHGSSTAAVQLEITPSKNGVKKVALSWNKSSVPISSYMILDSGVSFSTYIEYPYSAQINNDVLNTSGIDHTEVYTVGTGKDFTSFSDMLVALKDNTNKKIVYVYTGVYDIFSEIGGQTYIESIDTSDSWTVVNNVVPMNTKIVGVGDVVLRFMPTDEQIVDYAHGWLMSALNIVGSCEIENIAVEASNCRYAIHIESASGEMDANTAEIILKNVRAYRAVTTLMGDHQVIGTGIGHNARWTFEDCRMTSDGTSAIFSVHTNAPAVNSKAVVMLKDCVITSSHANAHSSKLVNFISQYLPYAITNIANIDNCFVGGKIGTETTITNRQSYDIDVIGGTSYGLTDSSTQTSGYTINNCGHTVIS